MKTINTLKAFAAAIVLILSFNAAASAATGNEPGNSNSESSIYYVVNRYDDVSAHDYEIWTITLLAG